MSYETVSGRIRDILLSTKGVFNVHTYFRDIPDEAGFQEAFSVQTEAGPLLTGWMMTRTAVDVKRPTVDVQTIYDITHKFEIQGIYGLSDKLASEKSFQEILDNVLNVFRTKFLLEDSGGTALPGIVTADPIQMVEIGHAQFSNLFVHFVRMVLSVKERIP